MTSTSCNKIRFESFFILWFILAPILSFEETATLDMYYVFLLTLPVICYAILFNSIRLQPHGVLALLFFISSIISLSINNYGSWDLNFNKKILFVLFFICATSATLREQDLLLIFRGCYIVAICISFLILASFIGGYPHIASSYSLGRYSIGITGIYKNPNYLTSFINYSFFIVTYILFQRKNSFKQKVVAICSLSIFLVAFFLSGTRASIITALIAFTLTLVEHLYYSSKKSSIYVFVIVSIAFIISSLYISEIMNITDKFLNNREFFEDEGRTTSWLWAINNWIDSPLLGWGSNAWINLKRATDLLHLHNIFLELILEQGILGMLIMILLVFSGWKKTKKNDRFFLLQLIFITSFPMLFQNGLWDVNLWRFILINRVAFNYSIYSDQGIKCLITK